MLECLEFNPKEGVEPIGSVIWLHGLGASGDDFAPVVPHMQLPDVRFVFPHAPVRPITIFEGEAVRAWYDITTLGESPERESMVDVMVSAQLIEQLIEREIERGIPSKNIVLMGFSQGAAMALHVGHRFHQTLMAVLILSGYMLKPTLFEKEMHPANRLTPYHFYHGVRDLTVLHRRGDESCTMNAGMHRFTYWKEFSMGHEVCLEEIRQIRFLLHEKFQYRREQKSLENPKG
jgi:phospholipase/carboxylesterase